MDMKWFGLHPGVPRAIATGLRESAKPIFVLVVVVASSEIEKKKS